MKYIMVDSINNGFDTKKWGENNKDLAEKSYEQWKKDNVSGRIVPSKEKESNPTKKSP